MKKLLIFPILILLAGCMSNASYVLTGKPHPKIDPSEVKIFDTAPQNAEKIGIISGQANHLGQSATDSIVKKLKRSASEIGANCLVIDKNETLFGYGAITHVSGTAFFVP
jgi:hypothetical protein